MFKLRVFTIDFALLALAALAAGTCARAADGTTAADETARQLIGVLESDAPKADKALACKRLAVYGGPDAVPALAALLPDEQLASWARIALEAIPDPAAGTALRDALGQLNGRLLVGVIHSLGVRRDAQAVDGLAQRLQDADADVACAAAASLGRIGNDAATRTLSEALAGVPAPLRSAVAEGCVLCAERLLADGQHVAAAQLYDTVRAADVPQQRVLEATRGAILARQSDGIPLLVEQLESPEPALLGIGLTTARELAGSQVTEALVAQLGKLPADRQALLMLALADRGDTAALPAVLEIARRGSTAARVAALGVLARLGDASCVPELLEIAVEGNDELAPAAIAALEELPGEEVDARLVDRLNQAQGKLRQLVIQLVGQRRIDAVPALLKAADDADAEVRCAALTALGSTVGPDHLSVLIRCVVQPRTAADAAAAEQALRAAGIRMPDRDACARQLAAAIAQAPVSARCTILEILGTMGGSEALQAVAAAAHDASPEMQDTASRLLGEWMNVDAAPVLLELAKSASDDKYAIRALRGYLRLARQFDMPERQRSEMCRTALELARRDAEKKLVLEVLERYPNVDTLKLAIDAANTPSLKRDASATALAIAQKIAGSSSDVLQLLGQLGQEPVKLEIVKAEYGAGTKFEDVTEILRRHARNLPLIVLPSPSYNASLGGDPVPQVPKQLKIQYRMNGKAGEVSLKENATILLPMPQ